MTVRDPCFHPVARRAPGEVGPVSPDPGDSPGGDTDESRPIGDLLQIFALAVASIANPTLLAALTVMLLLPDPRRLMLGYLLGAYVASIAGGLVIVFALQDAGVVEAGRKTISPAEDIVLGALLLLVALVLRGGRRRPGRGSSAEAGSDGKRAHRESLPIRLLGRGSARVAFAVGVILDLPGATYFFGLGHIDRLGAGTAATVLLVVGFCLIQLLLLELPLLGYLFAPRRTRNAVRDFRAWLARSGRRVGANVAAVLGAALLVRAAIVLLS